MTQMTQSTGVGQGQGTELTYPLSQFCQKKWEKHLNSFAFCPQAKRLAPVDVRSAPSTRCMHEHSALLMKPDIAKG